MLMMFGDGGFWDGFDVACKRSIAKVKRFPADADDARGSGRPVIAE